MAKKTQKQTQYKNTLNLMIIERPAAKLKRTLPYIVLAAVLIGVF